MKCETFCKTLSYVQMRPLCLFLELLLFFSSRDIHLRDAIRLRKGYGG